MSIRLISLLARMLTTWTEVVVNQAESVLKQLTSTEPEAYRHYIESAPMVHVASCVWSGGRESTSLDRLR